MKSLLLSFLLFVLGLLPLAEVRAITVSPATVEVRSAVGKRQDFSFVVTNDQNETLAYAFNIQKFIPRGETGQPFFLPSTDLNGLPEWLFLEAPTVQLRPGESRRVAVSLRVPQDAPSGGHYAAIFLTQTSLNASAGQNVIAIPRIGVLVFATVDGLLLEKASVKDVKVVQPHINRLPVSLQTFVENLGNVHVEPSVEVEVVDMFGKSQVIIDANKEKGRVLPSSTRVFLAEWKRASVDDGSGFFYELQQEWRNWGFGVYKARIKTSLGSRLIDDRTISFQVWPSRTISSAFLVLGAFIVILLKLRRKRR